MAQLRKAGLLTIKGKKMNRKLMLMTVAIIATATAQAQYVTYNHDSPKQNQITVMETGAGSLTPELCY